MPTPTGTISLSNVNTELGRSATANINMNDSAVRALAGVGGSGTIITMDNLRGKSSLAATLPDYGVTSGWIEMDRFYFNAGASYGEAIVDIILFSSGTGAYRYGDSGTATTNFTSFTWKTGGGSAGDYYAHMAAPSGDSFAAASSATNTALALSSNRNWQLLVTSSGNPSNASKYLTSTLQIRKADGSALVSKSVSMSGEVALGFL
jgi:hypothetical protein